MRLRSEQVSPSERAASFVTAAGVTVGTALLVLAALVPSLVRPSASATEADARHVSDDYVVFVAAPTPATTIPARRAARSPTRNDSRPLIESPTRETLAAPARDTTSVASQSATPLSQPNVTSASDATTRATGTSRVAAGPRATGAVAGFTRPSSPIRFDSVLKGVSDSIGIGLANGWLKPPPPTQAEIDAKWRDEAFEVAAARAAGVPLRRTMAGGSVAVPLPFGGPSRKQRERDRAIEAQLKVTRALRQVRVDSTLAARARRRADSLARATDTLHQDNQR